MYRIICKDGKRTTNNQVYVPIGAMAFSEGSNCTLAVQMNEQVNMRELHGFEKVEKELNGNKS